MDGVLLTTLPTECRWVYNKYGWYHHMPNTPKARKRALALTYILIALPGKSIYCFGDFWATHFYMYIALDFYRDKCARLLPSFVSMYEFIHGCCIHALCIHVLIYPCILYQCTNVIYREIRHDFVALFWCCFGIPVDSNWPRQCFLFVF